MGSQLIGNVLYSAWTSSSDEDPELTFILVFQQFMLLKEEVCDRYKIFLILQNQENVYIFEKIEIWFDHFETESVAHILQIRSTHSGMVKASELENPLERRRVWGRETQPAVSDSHKILRNERIGLCTFKCMSRKKIRSRRKKLQLFKVGRISGKSNFRERIVACGR